MIKFKIKNADSAIEKLEEAFDEAQSDFKSRLENFYGDKFINEKMFKTGNVFKNRDSVYRGSGADKKAISNIGQVYQQAWQEQYKKLQERHKRHTPAKVDASGETPHIKRKRRTQGQPAPHNNETVVFEDNPWTVWTGLFREKVGDAFTKDFSNQYVEVANLLISGGFKMVGSGYPHLYDKFTRWFKKNGIVDQTNPFQGENVAETGMRNKLEGRMQFYAEKRFAEPFVEVFNNLDVKI